MFHSKFDAIDKFKTNDQDCIYLFGYGSLLWKTNFEYDYMMHGYVNDFERQFWLLSDDHRGTQENYGRVLTLVQSKGKKVCGIAYKINSTNLSETFEQLNLREKCGYSLKQVDFYQINDENTEPLNCVCYFANEDNFYYSPENDINKLAKQIYHSVGPSGTNKEYLYNACDALEKMFSSYQEYIKFDSHLFQLNALVKDMDKQNV